MRCQNSPKVTHLPVAAVNEVTVQCAREGQGLVDYAKNPVWFMKLLVSFALRISNHFIWVKQLERSTTESMPESFMHEVLNTKVEWHQPALWRVRSEWSHE